VTLGIGLQVRPTAGQGLPTRVAIIMSCSGSLERTRNLTSPPQATSGMARSGDGFEVQSIDGFAVAYREGS
jgi:hypothetical protein